MVNKSCPVSLVSIDGNLSRIMALYLGILFSLYLLSQETFFLYILIADLVVRLFVNKVYSPLFILSKKTKELLQIKPHMVDSAAKRLASIFALLFLTFILFFNIFDLTLLFYIFSVTLLLCILLEILFSYCIGCEIYYIYKKIML